MIEIEKMLRNKKLEIDQLEAPDELEERLYSSLTKRYSSVKLISKWKVRALVMLIAIILVGYNIDTLAFYGKKLVGYDQIMNGTLKQLNEMGKGQVIGEDYKFKNGVTISFDGLMLDENQLLIFYTVKDPSGNVDEVDIASMSVEGIFGEHNFEGGQGEMNEEKTEIKWMAIFETPYFLERKLIWNFALVQDDYRESGDIFFKLDRNKAMGYTLKKEINETIKIDETNIHFESILASPTTTVIKGEFQNIVELVMDQISGERFRPEQLDIKLIANGKELLRQGGGMSTSMKGMKFHTEFDALPPNLEQLLVKLVSFGADHDVNEQVKLKKDSSKQTVQILDQNIEIDKVYESNGETYVMITTENSVVLSRVYLMIDGKKVELQETISDKYNKKVDGTITHTRTLRFIETGDELHLDIQRMKYNRVFNQVIYIDL